MRTQAIIKSKIQTNKASSKNNAACTIKDSDIVDVCTSTDDLIVKKYVDACSSTDDVCTNENEPCTNENEPCTNENEPCTNENEPCTNEPCTNENEPCTSDDNDDDDVDDENSSDIDIDKLYNFNDKVLGNLIIVSKIKKEFSTNIKKIIALLNKVANIFKNDLGLKFDNYKELNILADYLINHIWITIYGNKRVNNEINNIDADKKDFNIYVRKYVNIVNDKISLINNILELINDLMRGIDVNTSQMISH